MENLLFLLVLTPSIYFFKHSFVSIAKNSSKNKKEEEVDLLDSRDKEDINFYYFFLY